MISPQEISKALAEVATAKDPDRLEQLRLKYLGRNGLVIKALRQIGKLQSQDRAKAGAAANQARDRLEAAIAERRQQLAGAQVTAESQQPLDLTAPAPGPTLGHLHPLKELEKQLIEAFWQIGFQVIQGPEIETDWYNFEALNIPADHPARDMQATFYLENGAVPRTHTSPVQIRYMETIRPPIRIISPGPVYRNEDEDPTHLWAFHQLEGLVVDEGVSLADLKGTLIYLIRVVFGEDTEVRFLPSYFPYTEPSLEVHGRLGAGGQWLELAGAGMVHPQVLRNVGIDPEVYSGFAFGAGLERLTAIRHGITDLRYLWRPNLRFVEQF